MAKVKKPAKKSRKKPIEQYAHEDKQWANNPPVGLVTQATDKESGKKTYAYDPHFDPQLVWAGKAERTSFEVPTVSLHVHERIDPRTIVEAVRRRNGSNDQQMSLFQSSGENPPLREAIEFYKHPHNWSNRLIAGDSLLVMNSLLEKEGMAGQVQMISDEWVKAVNEQGGFGTWSWAVSKQPGDVVEILQENSFHPSTA
jgi:adenine-specific DNA-methyltransferase